MRGLALDGGHHPRPSLGVGECGVDVGLEHHRVWVGTQRDGHLDDLQGVFEADRGVALGHGATLPLVRVEQPGVGRPALDRGQLPRQVVGVGHAGVQAETTGGREPVGGVADQEHPAVTEAGSDLCGHGPRRHRDHLEGHSGVLERGPHQRFAPLGGVGLGAFGVGVVGMHVHPLTVDAVGDEGTAGGRVADPEEDAGLVADEGAQVRRNVHHHEALDAVRALRDDAEPAADGTRRAVAGQKPPAGHRGGPARARHRGRDALGRRRPVEVGRLPLVAVVDRDAGRRQRLDEHRLEAVLRQVAQRCRRHRELLVALALVGEAGDDLAAQLADPVHHPGVGGVLRLGPDGVDVQADLTPDLEGAGVDGVGRGRP